MIPWIRRIAVAIAACCLAAPLFAQTRENPIRIEADGRELPRHILHAKLTFPASPGPLTLYYPKWLPGEHAANGPIGALAGIMMTAGGKSVPWVRDTVDYFALHLDVPQGASTLEVKLDMLDAPSSHELGCIRWNEIMLYPRIGPVSEIYYAPSVLLPAGWKFASALDSAGASAGSVAFRTLDLMNLVDSPVMAGSHLKRVVLGDFAGASVEMDFFCDTEEGLDIKPETIAKFKRLVPEAQALFGARHFNHYNFLVGMSDHAGSEGLEHHQSTEIREKERFLADRGQAMARTNVLAHEFSHSWNGKYRRPVGLTFRDFQHDENSELLWVYEGLDQYLGYVLDGRAGILTPENARNQVVNTAAGLDKKAGRNWRPLRDTAILSGPLRRARVWGSWRRSQDYYQEGALIWLEADCTIRKLSAGKKSLDDFCRIFHGGGNTGPAVAPYSEDVVVGILNSVQPYDWKSFFEARVSEVSTPEPRRALEASGWKLVYADTASSLASAQEGAFGGRDLRYSLGISMDNEGAITDVDPDMPAGKAGLAPGVKVMGVNGHKYSGQVLKDALKAGKTSKTPLEFLVDDGDFYRTVQIDYHDGSRYPAAERLKDQPDYLTDILKGKAAPPDSAKAGAGRRGKARPH